MKKCFLLLPFICAFTKIEAQINLVKNGGFENYYSCPGGLDNIILAKYWTPIDSNGTLTPYTMPICTPEYCNICAPAGSLMELPLNNYFYHYPRSGNGFASGLMYFDNSFSGEYYQRDYFQGRLFSHLVAGISYCVTFYVSVAQASQYANDHIGAYLDNGSIDVGKDSLHCGTPQTSYTPQIVGDSIINDTLNWVKIQGSYIANGTESFITIGNFFDMAHTDTVRRDLTHVPWNTGNAFSYYLFDDVSIIESSTVANAGPDQWVSPGSDSVFIGIADQGLPTTWYIVGDTTPICYGNGGFKVHPDTTTTYVVMLDLCHNVTTDTVTIHVAPVGVYDYGKQLQFATLYPIPAKSFINVNGANGCTLRVKNIVGEIVRVVSVQNNTQVIDLSGIASGVYFIEIQSLGTGEQIARKIFKN